MNRDQQEQVVKALGWALLFIRERDRTNPFTAGVERAARRAHHDACMDLWPETPVLTVHVCQCGLPMSRNPHPDAGRVDRYLDVGAVWVCIPCTVRTRHAWAGRAQQAQAVVRQLYDAWHDDRSLSHWWHGMREAAAAVTKLVDHVPDRSDGATLTG